MRPVPSLLRPLGIGLSSGFLVGLLLALPLPNRHLPPQMPSTRVIAREQAQGRLNAAETIVAVILNNQNNTAVYDAAGALLTQANELLILARAAFGQQRYTESFDAATASINTAERARTLIEQLSKSRE